MLADYKVYKYNQAWVFQNDMLSMQKGRVNNYQKNTLGKFLSFDQGQNWLYIKSESFPLAVFEDRFVNDRPKPDNSFSIRQDKFRYQLDKNFENETIIHYLY